MNTSPPCKENGSGLARIIRAGRCSLQGLKAAWQHEAAFRQEIFLSAAALPAALWMGRSGVERALLAGSVILVLVVELLNSAVEAVVDRIGPEHHPLSGRAKDLGSAAVAGALFLAALTWALVLTG